MTRFVDLGNGSQYSLAAYVQSWKQAKSLPLDTPVKTVPGQWWPGTVSDVLRELRSGIDNRINRHDTRYGHGRKWHHDWQRSALQTARAVNSRCVIHWVPFEFRGRLKHRVDTDLD
jgi:hypothetical protein